MAAETRRGRRGRGEERELESRGFGLSELGRLVPLAVREEELMAVS